MDIDIIVLRSEPLLIFCIKFFSGIWKLFFHGMARKLLLYWTGTSQSLKFWNFQIFKFKINYFLIKIAIIFETRSFLSKP